jgi:hypothetical protein
MPDPIEEARDQAVFGVESAIDALAQLYHDHGSAALVDNVQRLTEAWLTLSSLIGAARLELAGRAAA